MKAFVCVKQVPDTETKIKLKPDASGIDTTGVKWVMNPYDEFAVEEAIKMKEAGKITSVVAISLGPKARTIEVLRTALAMGADEAIVVDAPENLDPIATAKGLAGAIKSEGGGYLCVLTGKLAIDDNAASVSQMVAEFLNLPHATVVSKIELGDGSAAAERETEGGTREISQLKLPAVIAANKGLNVPRYASLPGIMKAKKKVVKELSLEAVGASVSDQRVRLFAFQMPPEKPPIRMLSGAPGAQAAELAKLLREDAKVI